MWKATQEEASLHSFQTIAICVQTLSTMLSMSSHQQHNLKC